MLVLSTRAAGFDREAPPAPEAFARQAIDLGFRGVLLDVRIPQARFADVVAGVRAGGCQVVGAEVPCPRPAELERKASLGRGSLPLCDPDPDRRAFVVKLARRTLEHAGEAGIPRVLVSAGRIPVEGDDARHIQDALDRDGLGAPAVGRAIRAALERRAANAPAAYDALRRTLDQLLARAEPLGLRLALVQGEHLFDMPGFQELDRLLQEFEGAPLDPWLDLAATMRAERLEIRRASTWFERFGPRAAGVFVADARWRERTDEKGDRISVRYESDLAPGTGELDFAAFGKWRAEWGPKNWATVLEPTVDEDRGRVREAGRVVEAAGLA